METNAIAAAADALIVARRDHVRLDTLEPLPATAEEARAVADRVAEVGGWTTHGWKIGCTSVQAQEMLGADGPFSGRIYARPRRGSAGAPALLGPGDVHEPMLEGEFAFTLGSDLPARAEPYSRAEVTAATTTLHPAIEVIDMRIAGFPRLPLTAILADAGANGLLVLGPGVSDWGDADLTAAAATMTVDGEVTGSGTGADVLGHPLDALAWLATHLSERGIGLQAGQVVTTGTCTQVSPLPTGSTAVADFGPFGTAAVTRQGV